MVVAFAPERADQPQSMVGCIASLQGQPEALDPCAGLAASLSRLRLIDEYRLYLHPVVLGGGKPFFEAGTSLKLRPLGVESLAQGVTMLRYALAD